MIVMKYIKIAISAIVLSFSLSSCSEFMDRYPLDSPSTETFYSTEEEMTMALNGCYSNCLFMTAYMPYPMFLDMASDIGWYRSTSHAFTQIGNGSHTASTAMFYSIWTHYYNCIGKCNRLIEGVEKNGGNVPESKSKPIVAQARFIRAMCYLHLAAGFGDVPLVVKTTSLDDAYVTRDPQATVYDFICSEMDEIAMDLPLNAADKQHAERGTAYGLKARAALYAGEYEKAATAAKACMDLNKYTLHDDYADLFHISGEKSNEIMLSFSWDGNISASRYTQMRLNLSVKMNRGMKRSWVTFVPTFSLVDSYECTDGKPIQESPIYDPANPYKNRDPRMGMTIMRPGDNSGGYIYNSHPDSVTTINVETGETVANTDATNPNASYTGFGYLKYYDESEEDPEHCKGNFTLMRYAEVLLTYAEAKIELNQIDQTVYDAINLVRGRATVNMPKVNASTYSSQAEWRRFIRRERKVELAEEGFRLYDIRRWKIADKVMNVTLYGRPNKNTRKYEGMPTYDETGEVPNYDAYSDIFRVIEKRTFNANRDYLFPIPQSEIDANGNLTQNPGY
jgi:hypothetical protein